MTWVALYGFVVLFGIVSCRSAAGFVRRLGLLDRPNARSSHLSPTPRGAGLGILAAIGAGVAAHVGLAEGAEVREWAPLVGAAAILGAAGFVDDRRGLGAGVKLLAQVAAGLLAILGVGVVRAVDLPGLGTVDLGSLSAPLTLLFIVGFANGFNFMDGSDGMAGLFAAVSAAGLALLGAAASGGVPPWMAIVVSAAALSFLPVNWSPALAFMGDAGSLPLGLLLGATAVGLAPGVPFVACFLVLGPFLFDTLFTLLRRGLHGENVLRAHRSHLYQRLIASGLPHREVALLYGGWTLLSTACGLLYLHPSSVARSVAIGAVAGAGVAVVLLTGFREGTRGGHGRVA